MDDAGVYRISDDIALVQTVDFFFPLVNDPRTFGRIAAANSLSDVWAMGGKALTAMNVLAYPSAKVPEWAIEELLIGGSEKLAEAGVVLVGGHTMDQEELIYGMSVTGTVHPDRIRSNAGARIGDKLILTKPLGIGIYSAAYEVDALSDSQYELLIDTVTRLNKYAAEAVDQFDVSAMTDVTGFGLLGHLLPIARAGNATARIVPESVPTLPGTFELLAAYGARKVADNVEYIRPFIDSDVSVLTEYRDILEDAQTSGGLLIAIRADQAEDAIKALREAGDFASAIIGELVPLERKELYLHLV